LRLSQRQPQRVAIMSAQPVAPAARRWDVKRETLIVRLFQPNPDRFCDWDDRFGIAGGILMPVAAVLHLKGDAFGYFTAWMDNDELILGERIADLGWPERRACPRPAWFPEAPPPEG
jgi:hypothetical protein